MSKGGAVAWLRRSRPLGLASKAQQDEKPRKSTLAERVYAIQGYPKYAQDARVVQGFVKLAVSMTGVTNIFRGRAPGAAGVAMSKVPGKALSTQAVNPNRSVRSAMTALAPKAPT